MGAAGRDLTEKICWSIRSSARRTAEAAGAGSSISRYVSTVISERDARWRAALDYLVDHGWTKPSIREVCLAIPNPPAFASNPKTWIRDLCDVTGTVTDRVGEAFLVVAKEYATHNPELVGRL